MARVKQTPTKTAVLWVILGVIAGSFIPDNLSPLALIKKFKNQA